MANLIIITKHKSLVDSHRELFINFMNTQTTLTTNQKAGLKKIYDQNITPGNIKHYYNRKINIFLVALLFDKLDSIKDYFNKNTLQHEA